MREHWVMLCSLGAEAGEAINPAWDSNMPRCPKCNRRIAELSLCPSDGAQAPGHAPAADIVPSPPPAISGYLIEKKLGAGGFSIVWDARREADGRPVAIKIGRGNGFYVAERFRRDAEALERIGPPYVPELYEHGVLADGRPFIAMQRLRGTPLSNVLEGWFGPPELSALWPIATALCKTLSAAHERGVLHRDLKPENIFWDSIDGVITLIDFGLTKNVLPDNSLELTRAGAVIGTAEYMAPEQIRGDADVGVRADLYAAGVILYELCTLHLPFEGERSAVEQGHLALRPPRPRVWAPIPEELEELILLCLAKEPNRRPDSAVSLLRAIEALKEGRAVESSSVSAVPTTGFSRPAASSARPHSSRADLLGDGRRPAVLLALKTNAAAPHVHDLITKNGGVPARQRGMLYIGVFSGADVENPVQAALSAATEAAVRFGAKAALHLAPLALRRQEGRAPAFLGRALERPETWLPAEAETPNLVLTADLARTLPWSELSAWPENTAFYVLEARVSQPPQEEPASLGTAQLQPPTLRSPNTGVVHSSRVSRTVPRFVGVQDALGEAAEHGAEGERAKALEGSSGEPAPDIARDVEDLDVDGEGARLTLPAVGNELSGAANTNAADGHGRTEERPPRVEVKEPPATLRMRPDARLSGQPAEETDGLPLGRQDADTKRKPFLSTLTAPPFAMRSDELAGHDMGDLELVSASLPSVPQSMYARLPLFGREDVCEAILQSAETSFTLSRPALFTLLGDSGLGKTRMAAEALRLVEQLRPGLVKLELAAVQPLGEGAGATARALLNLLYGFRHPSEPAEMRAILRARLSEQTDELWPAIAAAFGIAEEGVSRRSLGANHRGVMLAIAEGFRALARQGPIAFVLDDAHWADDVVLDAIEYVTLNEHACPLWIMVTAQPRFENVRGGWGSRADRHDRCLLEPMREEAALDLAAELLLPAEYPPHATLRKLSVWSGNNPACLIELVRMLKQAGFVRRRPKGGTWYVATAELDNLPPSPAWQWLAIRKLDALPPELSACVRLCSVFGVAFCRDEIEWVLSAMEREGFLSTLMDIGVALKALLERKILFGGQDERYSFQSSTFQDAVYKLMDAGQREAIHKYAFLYWSVRLQRARKEEVSPEEDVLLRIARHGASCGEKVEAADAYWSLGESARVFHRHVEADQHYTAALSLLSKDDVRRRSRCFSGRGKVRYRVHRVREAIEDLREARRLSEEVGDDWMRADLLLEEATALDWASDFAASAACAELAREPVQRLGDAGLSVRLLMAEGRTACRQERSEEAIRLLTESAARAGEQNDHETRVISLLMLSVLLVAEGKLEEAGTRFDEVIGLCTAREDWLHLGIAYANRSVFWSAQKRLMDKGMEDLERAAQIAREVGNPWSERIATHNVAECLHWLGHEDEAYTLASRVRMLEQRFLDQAAIEGPLLLARVQLVRGYYGDAKELLAWIRQHCLLNLVEPTLQALADVIDCVIEQDVQGNAYRVRSTETWAQITQKASQGLFTEGLLEVLYWRARTAVSAGLWAEVEQVLNEAHAKLEECPFWRFRFTDLETRLLLRQSEPLLPASRRH